MRSASRCLLVAALLALCFVYKAQAACGLCGKNHCICIVKVDCPEGTSGLCGNIYRCERTGANANCDDKNVAVSASGAGGSGESSVGLTSGASFRGQEPSTQQPEDKKLDGLGLEAPATTDSPVAVDESPSSDDATIDELLGLSS